MVPQEAVAAAAEIILQGDMGICECRSSPFDKHDVNPPCSKRKWALAKAQRALEAAAPYLRAQALEDAADVLDAQAANLSAFYRDREMNETAKASYDAISHDARMLRARAATERGQG